MSENNELIVKSLRAMADRIEQSPYKYETTCNAYGGRVLSTSPAEYGPTCYAWLIGDAEFVASHAVVNTIEG